MNKKLLALGLFCTIAFPLAAAAVTQYHAPASEPERALDAILMQQKSDSQMDEYLVRKSADNNDGTYAKMFTSAYKKSVLKAEAAQMKKECGTKYAPDKACGIAFSPVTCGQDTTDTVYLYHTIKTGKNEATIAYVWPNETTPAATYRMRRENGSWKIDGARCADENTRFNMK